MSNVTLDDLKSVDGTILTQWVGLHTEMFITQRAIEKRKETEAESVKEQKIAESVKEQKIAEYTTRQREAECATRQKEIDLEIAKEVTRQKEIEGGGRVGLPSTQQKRKRESEDEHDGQWLNNECRTSWRRMCSLSAEVWDHRPDHHPESLSDFLLRFDRWAKVGDNLRGTRHRIRFIAKGPGIFVVYYDPSIQIPCVTTHGFASSRVDHIINDFWRDGAAAPFVSSSASAEPVASNGLFVLKQSVSTGTHAGRIFQSE